MNKTMSLKAAGTLVRRSESVASGPMRGGEYTSDLFWSAETLYRHDPSGKYFVYLHGGAGVRGGFDRWINSRDEAAAWITANATDAVTGWGYTREQAEIMLDGGDPGRGERRDSDDGLTREDIDSLADDHEDAMYEDRGEAAFGRPD